MFDLKTSIENLYLVGPARAKILKKLEKQSQRHLKLQKYVMEKDFSIRIN